MSVHEWVAALPDIDKDAESEERTEERDSDIAEDDNDYHKSSPERKRRCNKNQDSSIISNPVTPVSISEIIPQAPTEIIAEIIQKKAINCENLAELIILMEKKLKIDPTKNFKFRFNQLIALCAFLVPMQVLN